MMKKRLAVLLAAALAVLAAIPLALAEPPAAKMTQVPGYFRMALGDFEVTALYDGGVQLPVAILKGASQKDISRALERAFVDPQTGIPTAVNTFLVNTGRNLVLVDTGAGAYFGAKAGHLAENIRAAGYDPAQVDTVLVTHLHSDHVLGLTDKDGKPVFPGAMVRVADIEAAYWLSPETEAKAPAERKKIFPALRAALAPYQASGKFKTFAQGEALLPGVDIKPLYGHTPGHCGFVFASGGQSLLFWGDVIHSHAVQFVRPQVTIEFDTDQKAAMATRKRVLAEAAKEGFWVAGAHLPFPGIGHVLAEGKGYAWLPVEYGPVKADK
jgi:glyoxylase-like metal-dependent hydrolase (beta-lactamase superfamily II)